MFHERQTLLDPPRRGQAVKVCVAFRPPSLLAPIRRVAERSAAAPATTQTREALQGFMGHDYARTHGTAGAQR
jgi:hypothetical protein